MAASAESPRRNSSADPGHVGLHSPAPARTARRSTADSSKQGWDSRTKVVKHAGVSDVRPGISKSTYAFSRASSDAGSVLDSVSSTPRGRGPTRLQHHHELQAVASRLQHVQSSGAPYSQHGPTRNPRTAAASVYDDCSDTASWADEHFDWRQQHAADLAQRHLESKQALGQLAGSLKCLEDTLHAVMAQQSHSTVAQASVCKQHARSSKQSNTSSIADGALIPARLHSASRASSVSLEDTNGHHSRDTEQVALAQKAAHVAKWVQQSHQGSAIDRTDQPCDSAAATAEDDTISPHQNVLDQEELSSMADRLVSCELSHQQSLVSVNLHVNADHDPGLDQPSSAGSDKQQRAAQTRYSKWLAWVSIVEDACSQLNVRNHNPGPGAKSVTYAQLLQDCASSALQ